MATNNEFARAITRAETRGSALLWIGVLAGPLAWTAHLLVNYMLEEFISCTPGSRTQGEILGLGIESIILTVNVVLAAVALAGGVVAFKCLRGLDASPQNSGSRARWMARAGIINSVIFLLIILVGFAPPFVLSVCRT
jgi:hypothetical protein